MSPGASARNPAVKPPVMVAEMPASFKASTIGAASVSVGTWIKDVSFSEFLLEDMVILWQKKYLGSLIFSRGWWSSVVRKSILIRSIEVP
jgi:hypothetical protein